MAVTQPGGKPQRNAPKYANAKTFKDSKGNIREVGTGKLIRAAAKPAATSTAPKGKTFTDGQGVLRKIGGVAVNPLDRQVDASILTQTAPLTNRVGDTGRQFEADRTAVTGAGAALGSELQALQDRIAGLGAQQLGAAASAAGGTGEQQAANLSYLQSILGRTMSDSSGLPGAVAALAAQAQGEGAGAAANIALGQRGSQNDLATMGGASALQRQATIEERMRARDTALRDYNDQIAAIKANRTGIKNELVNQSLDQQAARQQIRLAQAQFDESKRQFDESMSAQEQAALDAASGAAEASDKVTFGGLKLPAGQAGLVRDGIGAWRAAPDKKRTLNSFMAKVTQSSGLSRTMAARIAMKVLSSSEVKRYAKSRASFIKTMEQAGVSKSIANSWANKVFGSAASTTNPALGNISLKPSNGKPSSTGSTKPPGAVGTGDVSQGSVNNPGGSYNGNGLGLNLG